MAGSGALNRRHDGEWAWLIKAANGQVAATDGGQGYESKTHARTTLEKVISGHHNGTMIMSPSKVPFPGPEATQGSHGWAAFVGPANSPNAALATPYKDGRTDHPSPGAISRTYQRPGSGTMRP